VDNSTPHPAGKVNIRVQTTGTVLCHIILIFHLTCFTNLGRQNLVSSNIICLVELLNLCLVVVTLDSCISGQFVVEKMVSISGPKTSPHNLDSPWHFFRQRVQLHGHTYL
jgi:hypothetical protein